MKRNEVIAFVFLILLFTAIGIGASTYISSQDVSRAVGTMNGKVDTTAKKLQVDVNSTKSYSQTLLPANQGNATALASSEYLWAKGRLLSSPSSSTIPVFEVNPDTAKVTVAASLTVDGESTMGDIDANNVKATQVTADALTNTNKSWQVDSAGAMTAASATIKNNATVGGGLTVTSGPFQVGQDNGKGLLVFSQGSNGGNLAIVGTVSCTTIKPKSKQGLDLTGNVTVQDTLTANDFKNAASSFKVDPAGNLTAYSGSFVTTVSASDGYFSNSLTTKHLKGEDGSFTTTVAAHDGSFTSTVTAADGVFSNSLSTGHLGANDGSFATTLTANTGVFGSGVSSKWLSLFAGSPSSTDEVLVVNSDKLVIDNMGNLITKGQVVAASIGTSGSADVGALTTRDLVVTDVPGGTAVFHVDNSGNGTLAGNLTVAGSVLGRDFATNSGKFKVDSGGSITAVASDVSGDSTVAGGVQAGHLAVGGSGFTVDNSGNVDAQATNVNGDLHVTGTIYGNLSSSGAVSKANLTATNSLSVGSPAKFTVDSSGNTDLAGTLHVSGKATLDGDLAVGGDTSLAGKLGVTGKSTLNGDLAVGGDTSLSGKLDVAGNLSANNLRQGVDTFAGSSDSVSVTGMPSGAAVIITPQFSTASPYWATVSAGSFTIHGDPGAYSWIATW